MAQTNGKKDRDSLAGGDSQRVLDAPTQRRTRNRNRGKSDAADWASASPVDIQNAINAVTSNGYAVRFGYTRDGGAFAVGVLGDGEPYTDFIRPTEDIDLYLRGLYEDYCRV